MILTCRRELGYRPHGPLEVAHVIGVTIAEPVRVGVIHAATGNATVGASRVSRVIERAESVLARLSITCFFEKHGVDGGPARGVVPLSSARTAAERGVRSGLLINRLRSKKRPSPELDPDPVEQASHVAHPLRVDLAWILAREDVVRRDHWR